MTVKRLGNQSSESIEVTRLWPGKDPVPSIWRLDRVHIFDSSDPSGRHWKKVKTRQNPLAWAGVRRAGRGGSRPAVANDEVARSCHQIDFLKAKTKTYVHVSSVSLTPVEGCWRNGQASSSKPTPFFDRVKRWRQQCQQAHLTRPARRAPSVVSLHYGYAPMFNHLEYPWWPLLTTTPTRGMVVSTQGTLTGGLCIAPNPSFQVTFQALPRGSLVTSCIPARWCMS